MSSSPPSSKLYFPLQQAAFSSSEGQKALLEAASPVSAEEGLAPLPSPALRLALLHALSCSAMGNTAAEDALCAERGFQDLLRRALAQAGEEAGGGDGGGEGREDGIGSERVMRAKLRSKAAFVLKVGGRLCKPRACLDFSGRWGLCTRRACPEVGRVQA